jgi:DnaJ-class molecular chaperone
MVHVRTFSKRTGTVTAKQTCSSQTLSCTIDGTSYTTEKVDQRKYDTANNQNYKAEQITIFQWNFRFSVPISFRGHRQMLLTVTKVGCTDCKGSGLVCPGGCANSGWRPTKIKCPSRCVGNISISVWPPAFAWNRCSTCAGTGFQLEMCPSCKGTGKTTHKCYRCQGQGTLKLGDSSGYA